MIECADPWPPGKVLPVMGLTRGLCAVRQAGRGGGLASTAPSISSPPQLLNTSPPQLCPSGASTSIPRALVPSGVYAGEVSAELEDGLCSALQ